MMSAGDVLALALTTHDALGWHMASRLWAVRLQAEKRMAHACAALSACEPEDALAICADLKAEAGAPIAPFQSVMDEASFWADLASADELKAYSVACYLRFSKRDRAAFHVWLEGRVAA
jgi:hypothetical protein